MEYELISKGCVPLQRAWPELSDDYEIPVIIV